MMIFAMSGMLTLEIRSAHAQSYHTGDLNLDGAFNIADVQCMTLVALAMLAEDDALPSCLSVPLFRIDMNCDDGYNVADTVIISEVVLQYVEDIQNDWDSEYYAAWAPFHFGCQRDFSDNSTAWQCPYTFSHHQSIVAGHSFTCALDQEGRSWCWGTDDRGVLGNFAVTGVRDIPSLSHRNGAYSKIDANGYGTSKGGTVCAISAVDDTLWCWGDNGTGRISPLAGSPRPAPFRVGTTSNIWLDVAVGLTHTCGIQDTDPPSLWCWGNNDQGQLGVGGSTSSDSAAFLPREISNPSSPSSPWVQVTAGNDHTCAVLEDGTGYCWGRNNFGQVGQGDKSVTQVMSPTEIVGSHTWKKIGTYHEMTCGITTEEPFPKSV